MRVKIYRKEANESSYWLRLLATGQKQELDGGRDALRQEAGELTNIFGAIIGKTES
jgi:hypothetical protein